MFKEFFYFPKSDRKGILAALLVATAAIVGVWFTCSLSTPTWPTAHNSWNLGSSLGR